MMTLKQWVAIGALASASLAAAAQPASAQPNPADASAAVPTLAYESVFDSYPQSSTDGQPSADKVWRKANDEVAKADAHGSHATAEGAASPSPAKAAPMDHSKHH
jgi:hypothetical protein